MASSLEDKPERAAKWLCSATKEGCLEHIDRHPDRRRARSHRLSRIVKYLDEEFRLYATVKNELIVRHGEPVPDKPEEYRVLPHLPGFAAYIEAMTRVHEETVPFPFKKIEVKDLDLDFSANEIEALAPIFDGFATDDDGADAAALEARAAIRRERLTASV